MLEPIVGFFDKLIDQFTWRRLVFLAVLLTIFATGVWIFETYTQSFKLARVERQLALLEKLATVSSRTDVRTSPDLQGIATSITKQLQDTDVSRPANFELLPWAKKALATAAVWFVFALFILLIPNSYTRTKPETASVLAGITVFASPFIALAVAVPTDPWLNYAIYPIGHLFVLSALMLGFGQFMARRYRARSE